MLPSGSHRPARSKSALLRAALLALAAGLLCTAAGRAGELTPAETTQLLAKLQEHRAKFPSLTADFVEEKTTHLLQKPLLSQGTLSFQIPNKFRRELRGSNPSIMVSNGQKVWIYYPNFKEAELYLLGQRPFFDDAIEALTAGLNFQHVAEFYRYSASSEADGFHLILIPKSGGLRRILKELSVWVDPTYKIDRTIAVLPKGDQVITNYRNQKPTPLPASTFDYTPPSDAHISQPLSK
jgi:outer membrane lipoprotein-sorting protein